MHERHGVLSLCSETPNILKYLVVLCVSSGGEYQESSTMTSFQTIYNVFLANYPLI